MLIGQLPLLLSLLSFLSAVAGAAEFDPDLTGTWSTKSRKVVTGPDFYDPINDRLKEPYNTGISYSFTDDGFFEEAYYRAIANPTRPSCPKAMMQFQHGKYSVESNGSLVLTPFADDGRQLISDPCKSLMSRYYRYNQTEVFRRYEVQIDRFHNVKRLNLYEFDGSPLNPMFLMYEPPQMLPTRILNPVDISPEGKLKRDELGSMNLVTPLNKNAIIKQNKETRGSERWWWLGVIMSSIGGIALLFP